MNKHQGLVYWGPRVHIENFWYSGAALAMAHLISMFAFLPSSSAHSHFTGEGTGKRGWKKCKGGPWAQLPALTPSSTQSFYAGMMGRGTSTLISNSAACNSNSPMCGEWTRVCTMARPAELQDVVPELPLCRRSRERLQGALGLLRGCPRQQGSSWCAT